MESSIIQVAGAGNKNNNVEIWKATTNYRSSGWDMKWKNKPNNLQEFEFEQGNNSELMAKFGSFWFCKQSETIPIENSSASLMLSTEILKAETKTSVKKN